MLLFYGSTTFHLITCFSMSISVEIFFFVQEVTYWHASSPLVGRCWRRRSPRVHQSLCASLLFLSLLVDIPYSTLSKLMSPQVSLVHHHLLLLASEGCLIFLLWVILLLYLPALQTQILSLYGINLSPHVCNKRP